jgi:hypothetical protein
VLSRETLTTIRGRGARSRWPFVALVLVLMIGGLVGLLLLNTALAQGAFRLHDLQATANQLDDAQQGLARQVDELSDPTALATRAKALGMVPGGLASFLTPGASLPPGAVVIRGPRGDVVVVPPRQTTAGHVAAGGAAAKAAR